MPAIDATVSVDLDRAGHLFLFHPDDLAHRRASPGDWWSYAFAAGKELAAGRLVALDTAAGGTRTVRLTDGDLTDRERQFRKMSADFRYESRHGKVLVDGGDCLPSDDAARPGRRHARQWAAVPVGRYRVRVHAIDWVAEPGAVLEGGEAAPHTPTDYVFQFTPVKSFDGVPAPAAAPTLNIRESEVWHADGAPPSELPDDDSPLMAAYPFFAVPAEPFDPDGGLGVAVSGPAEKQFFNERGFLAEGQSDAIWALAPDGGVPGIGVLARPCGSSSGAGEASRVYFSGDRLVRIASLSGKGVRCRASVQPIPRPVSPASTGAVGRLKAAFARYAAADKAFRRHCKAADFEAEWSGALTSASDVTRHIIRVVPLTWAEKSAVLPMGDAERVEWLTARLTHSAKPR